MVILIITQWLHVLLGITWFGATIYADVILMPALMSLPVEKQRMVGGVIGVRTRKVITPVAMLVVVLGFIRGTFLGQLHSVGNIFGTTYGITWLIGLIVAVAIILWAEGLLAPAIKRLNTAADSAEYAGAMQRAKVLALSELAGFAIVFTCMILMRFGL
ncbi:MAG TPA: hypothetical protein VFQ25_02780 [Ktedonobacterales bacterium]|nr:hypothetical protein [Ktedonobacterales bacterium]